MIDYAGPLIDARKALTRLEDQLINKKDLNAAHDAATEAYAACGKLTLAVAWASIRQNQGKVIP
jgi:hypothetical protein